MIHGIVNLNKPSGWTSHDAVAKARGLFGQQRIGHAGTLDPNATGVLILCLGKATKLSRYFMRLEKEYHGFFSFGKTTDSQDADGKVLEERDASHVTAERIEELLPRFTGEIMQTPPMVSAVKVNGKRLYALAREGKSVDREARKIEVRGFDLVKYEAPVAEVRVVCSKGTYVRTLAADLGEELACGAFLQNLTRTRIGPYRVQDAFTMEDLARASEEGDLSPVFTPLDEAIEHLQPAILRQHATRYGLPPLPKTLASVEPLDRTPEQGDFLQVRDPKGRAIGVVEVDGEMGQLRKVFVTG